MSNVIRHPAFDRPAIENRKVRGRPKGTISFRTEARRRRAEPKESPYHPSATNLPPVERGKFFYPPQLLMQKDFCQSGTGEWRSPKLSARMVGHTNFISPLKSLLDQLTAEGHDVTGATLEWMALREAAAKVGRLADLVTDANMEPANFLPS